MQLILSVDNFGGQVVSIFIVDLKNLSVGIFCWTKILVLVNLMLSNKINYIISSELHILPKL